MGRKLRLPALLASLVVVMFSSSVAAGKKAGDAPNVPVFRTNTRAVLVDIAATDSSGKPVRDLTAQDFTIFDDGKQQTIRAFEEHTPDETRKLLAEKPPVLTPGVYSNWMPSAASGSINVILFDTLNMGWAVQAYARREMIRYLKTLPPGQQVALFTLGNRLRMVQGITGSSDRLIAAANHVEALPGFQTSEAQAQRGVRDPMAPAAFQSPVPGMHSPEAILQEFMNAEVAQIADYRMQVTLAALRDLARSLGTIPGRKSLIWVSGGFPALSSSFTESSRFNLYDREMRMTAALLAARQVAVYPIDARGLMTAPIGAEMVGGSLIGRGGPGDPYSNLLQDFRLRLYGTQVAMDEMAEQTGGRAFYASNDISKALRTSIDSGASYYTISYTPAHRRWDGTFRNIRVKVARQDLKLTYRRGYYAVADPFAPVLKIKTTKMDVQKRLIEAVQPNTPQISGIPLKAQALASGTENQVEVDYVIDARNLTLQKTGDDTRKVSYQLVAVAWDKKQENAAQAWEMVDKEIDSLDTLMILGEGIKSHRFLTLKPGKYDIYLGVIDVETKKIGTVVIPLTIPEVNSSGDVHSNRHDANAS